MRDDDDDWTGEPPEGRYGRERARPEHPGSQWQARVALSILGVVVLLAVLAILLLT
jgi:hypothetical protein